MRRATILIALIASTQAPAPRDSVRVGQAAPPIVARNIDGNFDMRRYQRDYVLVAFWSLDGEASRRQFEQLRGIRRGLAGEGRLLILSVCTDDAEARWDDWRRFLEGQGRVDYGDRDRPGGPGPFPFFMDPKWVNALEETADVPTSRAFGVSRVPDAFLIGPDRRLRAVHIPTDRLAETVADAIKPAP